MATTWNPADDLGVALSNGDLTATSNAGGQIAARAHGIGHDTGKWYLEFSGLQSQGGGGYGVALLADTLSGNDGGRIGVFNDGALNVPGTNGGSGSSVLGQTIGLAIDFTDGTAWYTVNGSTWIGWNGGGAAPDPATNTNGASLSGLPGGLLYPIFAAFNQPSTCTLNTGGSAFAFSVPSGFTAWDSSPPNPPSAYGTVIM